MVYWAKWGTLSSDMSVITLHFNKHNAMNHQGSNEAPPLNDPINEAKDSLKNTVRETKDTLTAKTKEVAAQAKERGEEYVRQGKEHAADRIGGVSESIRQTADRFEQQQDPNIAHYTRVVAEKLEQAATYLRQHDLHQLKHDGEDLVRQHPAVFFGGMFIAGFAAARFMKASAAHPHHHDDHDDRSWNFAGTEEEQLVATSAQTATDDGMIPPPN